MEANTQQQISVGRVIRFAVATAMRKDEIARIEWRDFKDLRKKKGNDQRIPL